MRFGFAFDISRAGRAHFRRSADRRIARQTRFPAPRVEALDARQLLAVASPAVVMLSAATLDSESVTITYDVRDPRPGSPVTLGFYRSADSTLSVGDVPVESVVALPSVDSAGSPLGTAGVHTVTVPIPGGLPLSPARPYVLAVANPTDPSAADPAATASFRTRTIGVVTHGGIQNNSWKKYGPPWTKVMARALLDAGYDEVIPYNWVAASNTPGAAAKQGPKLAKQVLAASAQFPANEPVNVHFIGHSEGAVVNTQAIIATAAEQTPQLAAGFWHDTLLDPHAANHAFAGTKYSVGSGPIGTIAKLAIDNYYARSQDPLAFVPDRINAAEVFYQQTPAYHDHGSNGGTYNLWGQVPVRGDAVYYNLTPSGIVHSGKNGVYSWYQNFVVPTLGDVASGLKAAALTGSITTTAAPTAPTPAADAPANTPVAPLVDPTNPTYAGTAQPGSPVLIRVSRPNRNDLRTVARTTADTDGNWTARVGDIPAGRYRVVAVSKVTGAFAGKRPVMGAFPLGALVVNPTYRG